MAGKRQPHNFVSLPVLPLKETVIFPHTFIPLTVGRSLSTKAINDSINKYKSYIITTLQKEHKAEDINNLNEVYEYGTLCRIIKFDPIQGSNNYKLFVQGVQRVKINSLAKKSHLMAGYTPLPQLNFNLDKIDNKALYDAMIKDLIYIIDRGSLITEALMPIKEMDNPIASCYLLLTNLQKALENQECLKIDDANYLVKITYDQILKQKTFIDLKDAIASSARENMTQSQKEYYLKEQMKAIKKELGEDKDQEISVYDKKLEKLKPYLSETSYDELKKQIKKMDNTHNESQESSVIRNYLDFVFDLPWHEKTEDKLDIVKAKELLDADHYDLVGVKERILEFLSIRKLNPNAKGTVICFAGPPGTGKTSFAKSIAKALGRKCISIALGGVRDEAEIRGHRRTYVGALPGKILQGIRQAKTINPVIVLDELDKLASDFRGDPSSALMEVLDPSQNAAFKDHYLNIDYDLSKVMFICTANNLETIPPALRDRLEIIPITGYCEEEKIQIAKNFLVKRNIDECGLNTKDVNFSEEVIQNIIRGYTMEYGVRSLSRQIEKICRKIAKRKASNKLKVGIKLNNKNLIEFLEEPKFNLLNDIKNGVGVITGLAVTSYGGEIMKLESILLNEKGAPVLTGSLGEVMRESASIAVSWLKHNADKYKIDTSVFEDKRIHIHCPAGGVPKDGPSAGVAITSSLLSILKNKKIKDSIAMTGEITLTGKVLPVGGIKEKVLAAIRSNISMVYLPQDNRTDFMSIPENLRTKIKVKFVSSIDDIAKEIFE